jgi:hypothetical protein
MLLDIDQVLANGDTMSLSRVMASA